MVTKKLQLDYRIPVTFLKEGRYFIAHSPALDLATSATSFEKVKKRFTEAVEIFIEELMEKGTADTVFAQLGWKKIRNEWIPPTVIAQESEDIRISVPV